MAFPRVQHSRWSGLSEARPSAASRSPWVQSPLVQHVPDFYTKTATYDVTPGGVGLPPIRAGSNYRFSAICLCPSFALPAPREALIGVTCLKTANRSWSPFFCPISRVGSAPSRLWVQCAKDSTEGPVTISHSGTGLIGARSSCVRWPAMEPDRVGNRRRRLPSSCHLVGTPTRM